MTASALTLLLALALPTASDEVAVSPPKAGISSTEIDFGALFRGEAAERTATLENLGGAPLVIDRVRPGCGCATVRIFVGEPRREIGLGPTALIGGKPLFQLASGESADLHLRYDTEGQTPKKAQKTLILGTNDPDRPVIKLALKVDVKLSLEIEPRVVNLEARRGQPANMEVMVRVAEGLDLDVVGIGNTNEVFGAEFDKVSDGVFKVVVSVAPTAPLGSHNRTLVIQTDHPDLQSLRIATFAEVKSAIRVVTGNKINKSLLAFGTLRAGQKHVRQIDVFNDDAEVPYVIDEAVIDSKWKKDFAVVVKEVVPRRHYRLVVTAKKGLDTRFFRGTIVVRATHLEAAETRIQFNGRVAAK